MNQGRFERIVSDQVTGYDEETSTKETSTYLLSCFNKTLGCTKMQCNLNRTDCALLLSLTIVNYWLRSSWSSSWQIWWCERPRFVSTCPTGCESSAPGSARRLQGSRWGLPGRTGWTTTLSGCAGRCSSPPCGCRWSRKGCSRRCPRLRRWREPCPGSVPGHSHEMHRLRTCTQAWRENTKWKKCGKQQLMGTVVWGWV